MAEPICLCGIKHLCWNITAAAEKLTLEIFCDQCQKQLSVPYEEIMAMFRTDKLIPSEDVAPLDQSVPAPTTMGTLVYFPRRKAS